MLVWFNEYSKNSYKSKHMCNGYRIAFDEAGLWSFGNEFAESVVNFAVDNSLSSHNDNHKNNFLALDEGPA